MPLSKLTTAVSTPEKERKRPFCPPFLCLSRACLCKYSGFYYIKWLSTTAVVVFPTADGWGQRLGDVGEDLEERERALRETDVAIACTITAHAFVVE
jgi:hypothetical protein